MRVGASLLCGMLMSACTVEQERGTTSAVPSLERPRLLAMSDMEVAAPGAPQRARQETTSVELERRAKRAMETYLYDPFSARFRNLRTGREGTLCGQVNAKNRLGAYVGFRDFVAGRNSEGVAVSSSSDGIRTVMFGSFADTYLASCASRSEIDRHYAATGRPYSTTTTNTTTTMTSGYVPNFTPQYEEPTASDEAAADFSAAESGYEDGEGDE